MVEKIIYVCINRTYHDFMKGKKPKGRESLYECTRKYWSVNLNRANQAEYVAGVCGGIVRTIYKKKGDWQLVSTFKEFKDDEELKEHPEYLSRYAFIGDEAEKEIKEKYIEKPMQRRFFGRVTYNY